MEDLNKLKNLVDPFIVQSLEDLRYKLQNHCEKYPLMSLAISFSLGVGLGSSHVPHRLRSIGRQLLKEFIEVISDDITMANLITLIQKDFSSLGLFERKYHEN